MDKIHGKQHKMDYPKSFQLNIINYNYFQGQKWNVHQSSDPFWRLYWNKNSRGSITFGKREFKFSSNRFYLIAPYTPFDGHNNGYFRQFYIHFTAGWPFNLIASKIYTFAANARNVEITGKIIKEITTSSSDIIDQKMQCMRLCLFALGSIPDKNMIVLPTDKRINAVDSYMNQNIHRSIKNEELANMVNMSTNAFSRLFKESTGLGLHAYFIRKKIELACSLLQYHDHTIEYIAGILGFCDRYHFTKYFKSVCGIGPAEYRKTNRMVYKF